MEDKNKFDKKLFNRYNCDTFTEFALAIQKTKSNSSSEATVLSQMAEVLDSILPKEFKLKQEELEQMASAVVQKFAHYGGVLKD